MASYESSRRFTDSIIDRDSLLEEALTWIKETLSPEEVFAEKDLFDWAKNQSIEDVCEDEYLREWALENGFVEEE